MALTSQGSALVAGGNAGGGTPGLVRVSVVRAFCIKGQIQEPGKIVEISPALARELVFLGKAAPAGDAQDPAPESSAPASPPKFSKKGKANAG